LFFAAFLLNGQQVPPATSKLPIDHPMLHEAFLRFAEKLEAFHTTRKAQLPPQLVPQLDRDVAGVAGVSPTELAAMFQATRAATGEVNGIELEMRQHANQRARQELFPVPATMRSLDARKQSAIASGIGRLRATLSAQSWAAVSGYINGALRDSFILIPRR
jgi:hypothetical protein